MQDTERDLTVATGEIEKMADATLLPDLQSAWENFVFRLERTWDRTERAVRAVGGKDAQSWLSANSKLRRTDPLLVYLRHARHAETHAISASISMDRVISVRDRFGRPFNIREVTMSIDGATLTIDLTSDDIGIDWAGQLEPGDPYLQAVVNRGKRYDPPGLHLGSRLVDKHPVAVATIEVVEGDRVRIFVTNKLPEHTTIHWHGHPKARQALLNLQPIPAPTSFL